MATQHFCVDHLRDCGVCTIHDVHLEPSGKTVKEEQQRALHVTRETSSKLLFRGWHSVSGGDQPGLNQPNRIVPRAFLNNPGKTVVPLEEMDNAKELVTRHTDYDTQFVDTIFSSWSACFGIAYAFAIHHGPGAWISVADVKRLSSKIAVYYAPDLWAMGLCGNLYESEWLIHGVVGGPGLHSLRIEDLEAVVFGRPAESELFIPTWWYYAGEEPEYMVSLSELPIEIQNGKRFAKLFLGQQISRSDRSSSSWSSRGSHCVPLRTYL